MQALLLINRGGGAGRSFSALALAYEMSSRGWRTLVVPDSRQEVLKWAFSGKLRLHQEHLCLASLTKAAIRRVQSKSHYVESAGFYLLSNSLVYNHFLNKAGVESRTYGQDSFTSDYDLAIVDTAPGFYRFPDELEQVLNASKRVYVVVPLASDFRAFDLAEDALDYFTLIREYFSHSSFIGAFMTLDRPERRIAKEMLEYLARLKPLRIFDTFIPFEKALSSLTYDRPLREMLPHSPLTAAYSALAHEILTCLSG